MEELESQISWMEEDLRELKAQLKPKLYKHYRNGKKYVITEKCMVQLEGEWVEAVLYKNYKGHGLFVRSVDEFFKKFKLEE